MSQKPLKLCLYGIRELASSSSESRTSSVPLCLQVDLVFARELSYFLVTMYVPCIMIVVVSWFAFWIDHKSAPARVTLGVSTLLALSTTLASIQKSLPPVAYMKVLCPS